VFRVVWATSAARAFRKLSEDTRRRIAPRIDALAQDPTPSDAKHMHGIGPDLWRIRVGDYRVVYRIRRAEVLVVVLTVGHRSDVYDRM
jgi:mRNA interferase RelE/StbE